MEGVGDYDVYNLARGTEVSDYEVFDSVCRATGVALDLKYSPKRPGEAEKVSLDYTKVKEVLSWSPAVHLREGIQQVVAYYLQTHRNDT